MTRRVFPAAGEYRQIRHAARKIQRGRRFHPERRIFPFRKPKKTKTGPNGIAASLDSPKLSFSNHTCPLRELISMSWLDADSLSAKQPRGHSGIQTGCQAPLVEERVSTDLLEQGNTRKENACLSRASGCEHDRQHSLVGRVLHWWLIRPLVVDGRQRFDSRTDGIRIGVDPVPQRALGRFFLGRRDRLTWRRRRVLSPYLDTGGVQV